MQKFFIAILAVFIFTVGFLMLPFKSETSASVNETYLRVHIRANSNSEADQKVKYEIKGLVVEFLTPKLENAKTLDNAKVVVEENLENISTIATKYLEEKGFEYKAKAKLNTEYFPTRTYESLTLEDGFYDALILELGSAEGDNWWCVVYPPLCFMQETSDQKTVYKSIIAEILSRKGSE